MNQETYRSALNSLLSICFGARSATPQNPKAAFSCRGVASEGDEMARKLGVRLSSSPGFQGLGFRVQARDAFAVSFFSLPWHRILCRNTV